jgi:hypothetical protein
MGSAEGLRAIQLLLAEYPQAAKEKNLDGVLPLHLMARHMGGAEGLRAIQLLLSEYPQAAKEKTKHGWLPLHIVAAYMGGAEGLRALQLLLAEYPQAAKERSKEGELPIRLICENENGATLAMVRELLSAYPEGINKTEEFGVRPYAAAYFSKRLPAEAIVFLGRAEQGELLPSLSLSLSSSFSLKLFSLSQTLSLSNSLKLSFSLLPTHIVEISVMSLHFSTVISSPLRGTNPTVSPPFSHSRSPFPIPFTPRSFFLLLQPPTACFLFPLSFHPILSLSLSLFPFSDHSLSPFHVRPPSPFHLSGPFESPFSLLLLWSPSPLLSPLPPFLDSLLLTPFCQPPSFC